MKSLYLRIWFTVVAVLALFALTTGWLVQRHLEQERARADAILAERMSGWAVLIQNSLPERDAAVADQALALQEWSRRLRVPLALNDMRGARIAASESYRRRELDGAVVDRIVAIQLDDGRKLLMLRPNLARALRQESLLGPPTATSVGPPADGGRYGEPGERSPPLPELVNVGGGWPFPGLAALPGLPREWPASAGVLILLALQFFAVAAGAYPVVRSLTRRLERLKRGVETFGAGALDHRVEVQGHDEVAAVASSFNQAAQRIEALVHSHQSLLANASHELRSPLARLKMAVTMLPDAPPQGRDRLAREIDANIAELDALVEEVLLSSRLDSGAALELGDSVDLLGLVVEEAVRVGAQADGQPLTLPGSDRLLRRAVRNLLENARRYGGDEITVTVAATAAGDAVEIRVCDRGPGVPEAERERIFEPFYRMRGHAEREGGVGLGLALVRQIAQRHGGTVHCEPHAGGGSCFVIRLPRLATSAAPDARPSGAAPRP